MATTTVRWVSGLQFVGMDENNHSVVLSGDKEQKGLRPSQLLLIALSSCSGVDVVEILSKKRQPVTMLEIIATGTHAPEPPWAYQTIHIVYRLRGEGLTDKAVAQAIALSEEKYCSVSATVRGVARITSEYEILTG